MHPAAIVFVYPFVDGATVSLLSAEPLPESIIINSQAALDLAWQASSALAERDTAARASSAYSMRHALSRDDSSNSSSIADSKHRVHLLVVISALVIASASANKAILRIKN